MSDIDWQHLRELFAETLALPSERRTDFVERMTPPGSELRAELVALLDADQADGTLRAPIEQAERTLDAQRERRFEGQRIGPYQVTELLGTGGMGLVYRGERVSGDFEQAVAIKFLRESDPLLVRRMLAERQNLSTLHHPHIAQIFDAGTTEDGLPYLVMEFIDGQSLGEYIDQRAPSLEEKLGLFEAICQAVDYSHRHLIIHCDLKPSNVMVTDQGLPKLIDYGIARQVTIANRSEQTATANRAWSPNYASPEQVRGEPLSTGTDVYALGLILFRLVVGYDAQRVSDLSLERAVETICVKPVTLPTSVPRDLALIIRKAAHKDPDQRYASASHLAEDIRRFSQQRPVHAAGDSVSYLLKKWLDRYRVIAAVVAIALVMMAVSVQRIVAERNAALESRARAVEAEAEARIQLERAEEVSKFLTDIFDAADVRVNAGVEPTARSLLDAGFADLQGRDEIEPEVKIELLRTMAKAYMNSGLESEAMAVLELARDEWGDLDSGAPLQHAGILNEIGNVHMRLENSENALAPLREALAIQQEYLAPDDPTIAHTLNNIGATLVGLDRLEEAREFLGRSLKMMEGSPEFSPLSKAALYHNLARVDRRDNALDRALMHINRALSIKDAEYVEQGVSHIDSWHLRSQITREMGDWESSISDLKKMLRVVQEQLPQEDLRNLRTQGELANYYHDVGEFETAKEYYEAQLEHPLTLQPTMDRAISLNNLASLYEDMQQYDLALPLFEESMSIRLRESGPESQRYALALNNLGRLLTELERFDESEAYLKQSLAIQSKALPENHARLIGLQIYLLKVAIRRGSCLACPQAFDELSAVLSADENQPVSNWIRLHTIQAEYWESQGEKDRALRHWQEAYRLQVDKTGAEHPFSARLSQSVQNLSNDA